MPLPPPKFKTAGFLACLVLLFQQIQAQDFIIKHDLIKDNTFFYRVGENRDTLSIKEIGLRRPGKISVDVENFNPFYWNAKVTTYTRPVEDQSSYVGMFLSGIVKASGVSGFPQIRGGADPARMRQLKMMLMQLDEYNTQLNELKYDIRKTESEIKNGAVSVRNAVVSLVGIDSLGYKQSREKGRTYDEEIDDPIETPFVDVLTTIARNYHDIVYTSFHFSYNVKGNVDINQIKLQIFPRNDSLAGGNANDTLTKFFPVQPKPFLKLRSSMGVTFTYFQDKNRSYYVKPDYTIGQGKGDLFTPVISTFINFYLARESGGPKWGGSFGFGIPVSGDRKEINFMLGVCTVLGRNELVILSAGMAGAKVDRLTDGWQVGQTAPSLSFNIPTNTQYRLGAYFSLTFNLKSVMSGKQEID